MTVARFWKWSALLCVVGGIVVGMMAATIFLSTPVITAQESPPVNDYTWRSAGMVIRFPGNWLIGNFNGVPIAASSPDALANALEGNAPASPAFAFLHYPQTDGLTDDGFLEVMFPGLQADESRFAGTLAVQAQFDDEDTGQTIRVWSFISPVTRNPQILMVAAPQDEWETFEPTLDAILSTAQFLDGDAVFEFLEAEVVFQFPTEWEAVTNGQVFAVAPAAVNAQQVVDGDLETVPAFIRAQILAPSGIGIDPAEPTAVQQVLERFAGSALEDVQPFMWGEGMPAAAAEFTFEDKTLLLVAVINDDRALLMGGGSITDTWSENRRFVIGALNMTTFQTIAPPSNLDAILAGEVVQEDGVFGVTVGE
jgi:hypothetical protein